MLFRLYFCLCFGLLSACSGKLDQNYQSLQRQCGASWVQERPGFNIYPIAGENTEPLKDLKAAWVSPDQPSVQPLDISPAHCVAVPAGRPGIVLIGRPETGAMNSFAIEAGVNQTLQLTPASSLKFNLDCPKSGIFTPNAAKVGVTISLNQKPLTADQAVQILRLYTIKLNFFSDTKKVAELNLADWEHWAEPAALKLLQRPVDDSAEVSRLSVNQLFAEQGHFRATLQWGNFLRPELEQLDSPTLCPIEVDHDAPDAPTIIGKPEDFPFFSVGSHLPLFVGEGNTLHYSIDRIAAQNIYKKYAKLEPAEQDAVSFTEGSLPRMERPGIYRLRAFAEDRAGNRSQVFEQIVNVLESHAVQQALPDGWQILTTRDAKRSWLVGPKWTGQGYVLTVADLQQPDQPAVETALPLTPMRGRKQVGRPLNPSKVFWFGDNSSEQICFHEPSRVAAGTLGRVQCLGQVNGQWQILTDQVAPYAENEDLLAADTNRDRVTDLLAQDFNVGLVRTLTFQKGEIVPTPDRLSGNLGMYGASSNKSILFLDDPHDQLFLMIAPDGIAKTYGVNFPGGKSSIDYATSWKLGAVDNHANGLPNPLDSASSFFPTLRAFNFRQVVGADPRDAARPLIYNWSDEGRNLIAWKFSTVSRDYQELPTTGLPDLYGKRAQFFDHPLRALVVPLNNTLAEPWELYQLNGRVWSLQHRLENPSAAGQLAPETELSIQPNRLDAHWIDFSEASRSWGSLSVKQGEPLPLQTLGNFQFYYRWTLQSPQKKGTQGPWLKGPLPYPQELGTFLLELRVVPANGPTPQPNEAPDVRRIVGVLPPSTTTRGALPGLGILMQVEAGQPLSEIKPLPSTRPGSLRWSQRTIEGESQVTTFELDQPWPTEGDFFTKQNLTAVVGRFNVAAGNPETICYIHKGAIATDEQGRMACLAFVEKNWRWVVEDAALAIQTHQEVQTIDLKDGELPSQTRLLITAMDGTKFVRIGSWDDLLGTVIFKDIECAHGSYDDQGCLEGPGGRYLQTPAYPIVIASVTDGDDNILSGYPYETEDVWDGAIVTTGKLAAIAGSYTFKETYYVSPWGWMRPYPTAWYQPEFDQGLLSYGRRYLRTQLLQVPLSDQTGFYRFARGEDNFSSLIRVESCETGQGPGRCYVDADKDPRNLSALGHDPDLKTFAMKSYQDPSGTVRDILVATPADLEQGYQYYLWSCKDGSCVWQKILTLHGEGY